MSEVPLRQLLVLDVAWDALVDHYDRLGIDIVRIPEDDEHTPDHPTYILSPRSLGRGGIYPGGEIWLRRNALAGAGD
jgi:hypothetical protein